MTTNSCWPTAESWYRFWPANIVAVIAVIQLLVSFIVVAIHTAIVVIGIAALCWGANSWFIMGFICWAIFLACWISIFCVICCNRSSPGCATYAMVKNVLAFAFAVVLIDFDRKFLGGDITILLDISTYTVCLANLYNYGNTVDYVGLGNVVIGLAKGQLAGSVLILVSALVFIAIYIYVFIRALQDDGRVSGRLPYPTQFVNGSAYVPPASNYPPRLAVPPPQPIPITVNRPGPGYSSSVLVYDNCGAPVPIPERF